MPLCQPVAEFDLTLLVGLAMDTAVADNDVVKGHEPARRTPLPKRRAQASESAVMWPPVGGSDFREVAREDGLRLFARRGKQKQPWRRNGQGTKRHAPKP